jgi:hypothetical protein
VNNARYPRFTSGATTTRDYDDCDYLLDAMLGRDSGICHRESGLGSASVNE